MQSKLKLSDLGDVILSRRRLMQRLSHKKNNQPKVVDLLPPATKLGQGYIFTGVCGSVHTEGGFMDSFGGWCMVLFGGCVMVLGGCMVLGGMHGPRGRGFIWGGWLHSGDPPGRLLLRAVRILLECILVIVILTDCHLCFNQTASDHGTR